MAALSAWRTKWFKAGLQKETAGSFYFASFVLFPLALIFPGLIWSVLFLESFGVFHAAALRWWLGCNDPGNCPTLGCLSNPPGSHSTGLRLFHAWQLDSPKKYAPESRHPWNSDFSSLCLHYRRCCQLVQISRSLDAARYSTRTGLLRDVVDWRLSRWDSNPSLEEPCDFGPISLPSCGSVSLKHGKTLVLSSEACWEYYSVINKKMNHICEIHATASGA